MRKQPGLWRLSRNSGIAAMKPTKTEKAEAARLFKICMKDGLLDEGSAQKVLDEIVQVKPRGYMPILWHFRRLVQLYDESHTAKVETATAMTEDSKGRLRTILDRLYGPGLAFSFIQDASLIGGMRVRVGSDVYDGSVRGRLMVLEQGF
jgi:F-type H+-transporting ATPase subunit delta